MQLSEKLEIFSRFFIEFLGSAWNFGHFLKKDPPGSTISEVNEFQKRVYSNA